MPEHGGAGDGTPVRRTGRPDGSSSPVRQHRPATVAGAALRGRLDRAHPAAGLKSDRPWQL